MKGGRIYQDRDAFRFSGPAGHVTRFVYAFQLSKADIAYLERCCGGRLPALEITGPDGERVTVSPSPDGAELELPEVAGVSSGPINSSRARG